MHIVHYPKRSEWPRLAAREMLDGEEIERRVLPIMQDVSARGDAALLEYTAKFDRVEHPSLRVSDAEITGATANLSEELKAAIRLAYGNIERFHRPQLEAPVCIETQPGVVCWRKSVPIQRVGLYIPGGTAPLFSTILMLGVPSAIAGVPERVLCTPPQPDNSVHPAILFTANLVGIRQIFKVGGAQAIAALTFGTETVPKVDKIFGPGNQYVTAAKQIAQRKGIAIDMPAGPSEVAVLADSTCIPAFVAADLLSQAEHGADSQVMFITTSEASIGEVLGEVDRQVRALPRSDIAQKALENSRALLFASMDEALEFANFYAAEHLIIASDDADALAERVVNAGSIFLGHYSPEAVGDYASGTNHTLPTNGYARAYSGVSVDSFVKKITLQRLTPQGIASLGTEVEIMAAAEGLEAHRYAVSVRKAAQNLVP
ncbi:MAG: histidinol dehydrogenase [Candidatus Kapaibacteriota bacterium]